MYSEGREIGEVTRRGNREGRAFLIGNRWSPSLSGSPRVISATPQSYLRACYGRATGVLFLPSLLSSFPFSFPTTFLFLLFNRNSILPN